MTEAEYRAAHGINKSTLWEIRKSPAHYQYALNNPSEDTPSLRLGRAVHAAILTPEIFKASYVEAPDVDVRTKGGKELYKNWLRDQDEDAVILSRSEMQQIRGMLHAFRMDKTAKSLISNTSREEALFWMDKETGLPCKCRVDAFSAAAVIDLKTTTDCSTRAFQRDAISYGYHVQAAHYLDGIEAVTGNRPDWYFIAIEKKPPYAVHVFKASEQFLELGAYTRWQLMDKLKHCIDTDDWPGYQTDELDVPAWAIDEE
ncbi:MAG: PD-(D/E)XK nuclease-like domain-containing protein [Clostridia bacterium]|nr:PD-(D/E)XK nuclease-like domain-containing protein [Clostridia bacterium]